MRCNAQVRIALAQFLDQPRAFTRAELLRDFSARSLEFALTKGTVTRVLPGIYAGSLHSRSFKVRSHAALLWARGSAALSGISALFEWGLVDEPPQRIEIWLPHERRLKPPPWLVVRRGTSPIRTTTRGNVQVATPAYAIVQGYAQVPPGRRADVVYRAVRRRIASPTQLRAALDACPRVAERRALERHVDAAAHGAESYLEEHSLWTVFNTQDFSRFVRQHEIVHEGEQFRLDMYDASTKTAVELDGDWVHAEPDQRRKDVRRDATLATRGILTIRYGFRDLMQIPDWCRMNLLQVLRSRALRSES